ncbi:hypothetical protein ACIB24_18320 [Spongisporangium articulatum]|uniref:Acetone carboxylase n=1 Tax=Spongisporangium articulatum TaxID=3362603 RepID=A0ABW8ASF0_9ACTN
MPPAPPDPLDQAVDGARDQAVDDSPGQGPREVVCSARGCRAPARWALRWNNPKLHPPERRKVWTACDEHRESLGAFLSLRGFLKDVVPVEDA